MTDGQAALIEATGRLERALNLLEMRVRTLSAQGRRSVDGNPFEQDRARLAEELDRARERGRALEEAAIEASAALGRAAVDMRAVLQGEA